MKIIIIRQSLPQPSPFPRGLPSQTTATPPISMPSSRDCPMPGRRAIVPTFRTVTDETVVPQRPAGHRSYLSGHQRVHVSGHHRTILKRDDM